jgi:hypothetical protein
MFAVVGLICKICSMNEKWYSSGTKRKPVKIDQSEINITIAIIIS